MKEIFKFIFRCLAFVFGVFIIGSVLTFSFSRIIAPDSLARVQDEMVTKEQAETAYVLSESTYNDSLSAINYVSMIKNGIEAIGSLVMAGIMMVILVAMIFFGLKAISVLNGRIQYGREQPQ